MTLRSVDLVRIVGGAWAAALALGACASGPAPSSVAPLPAPSSAVADPRALATLDEGERLIAAAAGDCGRACEGLGSVVRARAQLCAPRSAACEDAGLREREARGRVSAFCDPCGDVP